MRAIVGVRSDLPFGPVPIRQREALEFVAKTPQSVFQFVQKQPVPGQKAARVVRVRIVYQVLVDLKYIRSRISLCSHHGLHKANRDRTYQHKLGPNTLFVS